VTSDAVRREGRPGGDPEEREAPSGVVDAVQCDGQPDIGVRMSFLFLHVSFSGDGVDPILQMVCRTGIGSRSRVTFSGQAALGSITFCVCQRSSEVWRSSKGEECLFDIDSIH